MRLGYAEVNAEPRQIHAGGRLLDAHSQRRTPVVNPATEQVIGSVVDGDGEDVDRCVRAADAALRSPAWAATTPGDRAAMIARLASALGRRSEVLAELITAQNGMPISTSRAIHGPVLTGFYEYFAGLARGLVVEEMRTDGRLQAFVRREPVGVCALIAAWNGPQTLVAWKLGPALAAGCTAVVKPAPETTLDAYLLMDAVAEAGIPDGVVNLVTGDAEAGSALVAHPLVSKVAFTGSPQVGQRIAEAAAAGFRRVTLELGGKSAAVLLDDVDLEEFRPFVAAACSPLTGQTCRALTRVLAPRSRYQEVVEAVTAAMRAVPVGDPMDPTTVFGPLVSARQRERVEGYVRVGLAEGARLTTGGGRPRALERGYYFDPTVFRDVDNSMRIAREEIFGPVLTVIPYRDEEEAVRLAGDSEYGLGGGIFTRDPEHGLRVARRIQSGTIGVNGATLPLWAPFGGIRRSGIGRELGPEGLGAYLEYKTIYGPAQWPEGGLPS